MLDVYFYEAFEEETESLKTFLPGHLSVGSTWKSIQESGDSTPPASLISIRTQSRIPTEWGHELNGILSRSTGYDHLTGFLETSSNPVPCGYLPEYCARSVAEHAMTLCMVLLRKLPQQQIQFPTFNRDGITGRECQSQTLLVAGVGRIGTEIVDIGRALGMRVLGNDLVERRDDLSYVSLEEGIMTADIIMCAMNLTKMNCGLFSYDLLRKCPKHPIFINIARGEISATADLIRLLDERALSGVGLDVFEDENILAAQMRQNSGLQDPAVGEIKSLASHPNVILTPHNAFNTREALERKCRQAVEQILAFREGKSFIWQIPD